MREHWNMAKQELSPEPIYCSKCKGQGTWQRNPALDHKGINIGYQCPCGNQTWRRETNNKEGN